MKPNLLDFTGQRRRDRGVQRVASHNGPFLATVRQWAKRTSWASGSVTVDNLREMAAHRSVEPDHPNAWGAVFRQKGWKRVDTVKSAWPSSHARLIGVWVWEGK